MSDMEPSSPTLLVQILDVVLRVPPLFVLECILNESFSYLWFQDDQTKLFVGVASAYSTLMLIIAGLASVFLILLSTKQLLCIYTFFLTISAILASYLCNMTFIEGHLHPELAPYASTSQSILASLSRWLFLITNSHLPAMTSTVVIQCLLAFIYNSLKDDILKPMLSGLPAVSCRSKQTQTYLVFILPVIFVSTSMQPFCLNLSPILSLLLAAYDLRMVVDSLHSLPGYFEVAYLYTRILVRTYGLTGFVELQWDRLHVPLLLRLFWISRVVYHVASFLFIRIMQSTDEKTWQEREKYLTPDELTLLMQDVLIQGTDSFISILGMTSVVSWVTHYVGELFVAIVGSTREEDHYMGTMSAILFVVLALQTGLSSMLPAKRLTRLYYNVCLLLMAMLHYVHSIVHPSLQVLSAGRNFQIGKHARSLGLCFFLITVSCVFMMQLWNDNTISTWLLAIIAFGVELVIKVLISLLIYTLFMIDAKTDGFWEGLDDYIYYVKSTGNTIEFLFGLFLFGNGAWILVFESGGTIRAVMMCVHAYFNIWTQAKEGWKVFMKRRTAVSKIGQLPTATAGELKAYADVCAICYLELDSARVTRCRHMFHGVCLRKWIYIQDSCPICHQVIYNDDSSSSTASNRPENH